ncbi:MAG: hypothetical protein Q27BB25_19535 [Blastomonas sp. CACIA14H2]|nr:MAG: hypothetical protein Q27BB25_19535 [Blastomonas sp. CACIA14H2]
MASFAERFVFPIDGHPPQPPLSLSLSKATLYGLRGRGSFDDAG